MPYDWIYSQELACSTWTLQNEKGPVFKATQHGHRCKCLGETGGTYAAWKEDILAR